MKIVLKSMVDRFLRNILASLLLVSLSLQSSPTCFYPDSSIASDFNYTTCNLNNPASFSPCCYLGEGDICLSDGLCYWPAQPDGHGNYIYRAACTDKSWTDSACAQVCTVDDPNHFETVSFCPNTTDFCCAKSVDGDCCQYANLRFNLTIPTYILADLKNGTDETTAPKGFDPGTTATATGAASGSTSAAASAAASSKSGLSTGAAAGIAIAAVLVVVAIAVGILVYCWRRYHSRRQRSKLPTDDDKPEVIEAKSIEGLEVTTASFHSKPSDNSIEDGSRRESRRRSSSAVSPTDSRHASMALNQVASNTCTQDSSGRIIEDNEDVVHESGRGPTPEAQYLDGRHVGGERYELCDGTSTRNSYLSASLG